MKSRKQRNRTILETWRSRLVGAPSWVFVHWQGLTVGQTNELRRALKAHGVGFGVAKKTLLGKALEEVKVGGDKPALAGEIAVAYRTSATDDLAPARGVYEFVKKFKDSLSIVGGIFGGQYTSAQTMSELAAIPSREALLGKLLFLMKFPATRLVMTLGQISKTKTS